MTRRMNASKSGTVNAVSPCSGLQIIPLAHPSDVTQRRQSSWSYRFNDKFTNFG